MAKSKTGKTKIVARTVLCEVLQQFDLPLQAET